MYIICYYFYRIYHSKAPQKQAQQGFRKRTLVSSIFYYALLYPFKKRLPAPTGSAFDLINLVNFPIYYKMKKLQNEEIFFSKGALILQGNLYFIN
jgi:hypothetical protein